MDMLLGASSVVPVQLSQSNSSLPDWFFGVSQSEVAFASTTHCWPSTVLGLRPKSKMRCHCAVVALGLLTSQLAQISKLALLKPASSPFGKSTYCPGLVPA